MDTYRSAMHYEVTPDGKLGLYFGDELVSAHEVPEPWEYDAERARQRGDTEEVKRLIAEQFIVARDEMVARMKESLRGILDGN